MRKKEQSTTRLLLVSIGMLLLGPACTTSVVPSPAKYVFRMAYDDQIGRGLEVSWTIDRRVVRVAERIRSYDFERRTHVEKKSQWSVHLPEEDAVEIAKYLTSIPEALWDTDVTERGRLQFSHHPWYVLTKSEKESERSIGMRDGWAIREFRPVAERINSLQREEKRLHVVYLDGEYVVTPNKPPEPSR